VDGWTGVCLEGVGSTLNYQSAACEIKTIPPMYNVSRCGIRNASFCLVRFISYHTTPHRLSIPSFLTDPH